ncbi:MAG: UrcA family protein [Hyphomonas sp.]|uniref:UrcA family protein n=1 Tax=Hyphomonas sp. TaxID=87 RepID=UPI0035294A31
MIRPLIAAALAVSLAAPAFASSEPFRMAVQFDRDALATPAGAAAEYENVKQQVADRCEAESADIPFGKSFAVSYCERNTMRDVVRRIGNANFTAAHVVDMSK